MTTVGGMTMESVEEAVRGAMGGLEEEGVVDIEVAGDGLEVDVIGDEWTLHLEGWPEGAVAFLAMEDEPDDPGKVRAARAKVMIPEVDGAMVELDRRLEGTLGVALLGTGDPLSMDLAVALGARGQRE